MRVALLVVLQLVVGLLLTLTAVAILGPLLLWTAGIALLWPAILALLYRGSKGKPPPLFVAANLLAIGVAGLACAFGAWALRAAEASAAHGGGLLGAVGLLPLALGILLAGAAGASLWISRSLARGPG